MKIVYVRGDLLEAPERVILHGCNAQGKMNSGVAKAIRTRYPGVFDDYSRVFVVNGKLELGDVIWSAQNPHVVGNCITQEFYGREPNTRYVSYDAIVECIRKADDLAAESQRQADNGTSDFVIDRIAMPLMGAVLAQGRWSIISAIIEEYSTKFTPVVYLPDGHIDGVRIC